MATCRRCIQEIGIMCWRTSGQGDDYLPGDRKHDLVVVLRCMHVFQRVALGGAAKNPRLYKQRLCPARKPSRQPQGRKRRAMELLRRFDAHQPIWRSGFATRQKRRDDGSKTRKNRTRTGQTSMGIFSNFKQKTRLNLIFRRQICLNLPPFHLQILPINLNLPSNRCSPYPNLTSQFKFNPVNLNFIFHHPQPDTIAPLKTNMSFNITNKL